MALGPHRIAEMNHRHYGPADRLLGIGAHARTFVLGVAHSLPLAPITCCEFSPATGRSRGWHNASDRLLGRVRLANAPLRPTTVILGTTVDQSSGSPAAGTRCQLPRPAPEARAAGSS